MTATPATRSSARSLAATALLIVGFGVGLGGPAQAQDERAIGQREFEENCASCHGTDGKGNGPMASYLTTAVPDLTTIQATNQGVFPFARLYGAVAGGDGEWIGAHGARDMPVWGREYSKQGSLVLGEFHRPADVQAYARGRILALLGYIHDLQEDTGR